METFSPEKTLEDFYKSSQENLKKYSLLELFGPHLMNKKRFSKEFWEQIQQHPYKNLFCHHLENLSVQQAEVLSGFSEWKETKFHLPSHTIFLNGLLQLNESVAKALAPFKGEAIVFNGLRKIEVSVANAFATYQCQFISLDQIEELDSSIVQILSAFKGKGFSFNSLKCLDETTAQWLSNFHLCLRGLQTLDENVAKILASGKGQVISLEKKFLDEDTIKALSFLKKTTLYLDHLEYIDVSVAKWLTQSQRGFLSLKGLKRIDEDVAKALASFNGELFLDGLQELDVPTAKALASFKGTLSLNGLTQLETESAKALAYFETNIPRIELEKVPKEEFYQALALIKESGQEKSIHLEGLQELNEETAKALADFKGRYLFLGIKRLSKEVASVLASFACKTIFLEELEEIDELTAKALASSQGKQVFLGIKRIEESVSTILMALRPKILFHINSTKAYV